MKKGKQGRSKLFVILGISLIILLVTGFIMAVDNQSNVDEENIEPSSNFPVSEDVQSYIESFVEKSGISSNEINDVSQVDPQSLPKEVNIKNMNDANLAIYQIDYNKGNNTEKIFLITYAAPSLESEEDLIISEVKKQFLTFGFEGELADSEFLKTAAGVQGSLEKGYVMMREGSITGISTNLEVLEGEGELEIIIYKNGNPIQFGNSFFVDSNGVKKDYDIQSEDTVTFQAGDVISLYIQETGEISWKDVISLLEITN